MFGVNTSSKYLLFFVIPLAIISLYISLLTIFLCPTVAEVETVLSETHDFLNDFCLITV